MSKLREQIKEQIEFLEKEMKALEWQVEGGGIDDGITETKAQIADLKDTLKSLDNLGVQDPYVVLRDGKNVLMVPDNVKIHKGPHVVVPINVKFE